MNSSEVVSTQTGIHPNLEKVVQKHRETEFLKPIAEHTHRAFDLVLPDILSYNNRIVLDTGCGTGESTMHLAQLHTESLVIGIDRSEHRVAKAPNQPENAIVLRAEVSDFVCLCYNANIQVETMYFLFPNPSPKPYHLLRRWHAHPVFSKVLSISNTIQLRTNWDLYALEFVIALQLYGIQAKVEEYTPIVPISPFERKYHASGHRLYVVKTHLK